MYDDKPCYYADDYIYSAGEKDRPSKADRQIEMNRNDDRAYTMWLHATDRDALTEEAKPWNDARLSNVVGEVAARPWKSLGRQRRSGGRQYKIDDFDAARRRRYMHDHEENSQNNFNPRKRQRRPPVDPSLLMMGIGRRK